MPNLFRCTYAVRFAMWGTDEAIERHARPWSTSQGRRLEEGVPRRRSEVARCLWAYTSYYFDLVGLCFKLDGEAGLHLPGRRSRPVLFPAIVDLPTPRL